MELLITAYSHNVQRVLTCDVNQLNILVFISLLFTLSLFSVIQLNQINS